MVKGTAYITRGRALLVFRDPGAPAFGLGVPGGTVEPRETPEAALFREIREESGLTGVRLVRPLGTVEYEGRGGRVTRHYFHLALEQACPDAFTHVVRSADEDDGWVCEYFWADLLAGPPLLGGRLGDRLPALVRALAVD